MLANYFKGFVDDYYNQAVESSSVVRTGRVRFPDGAPAGHTWTVTEFEYGWPNITDYMNWS